MNLIKFSHKYDKFTGMDIETNDVVRLLQCTKIHYEDLSSSFKDYDTSWTHDGTIEWYDLPKMELILLLFKHNKTDRIFTTLRPHIPTTYDYYKSKEGKDFRINFRDGLKV